MNLSCSLCLYVADGGPAADAVTVMNGQAVCYDHLGYVAGGQHSVALRLLREAKA